ncbi:uncharacterized protein LOC109622622 [Aedes albopictus]|uniref:Osiris 21 n=1 Tax=Aedes albopictus TaxID=7160 RepID=A0ABM1XXP1_AEDAL|nr:uncharacterized protein LOC109622622 [Aedes albopictus]XP_029722430.1 uncharacterized protein LOC115263316 [Aedes albopictus]KXJ82139.1 hypothetical protein RP20_CCG015295 [Aedes albopictus]
MSPRRSTVLEYLLLASFITSALCATTRGQIRVVGLKNENSWFTGELSVLQKVYDDCQDKQDFTGCLKGKALTAISRAVDMESIPLLDGVALVKQKTAENASIPLLSDARALSGFGLGELDVSILSKLNKFFQTHSLRVDMQQPSGTAARGNKGNKHHRYIIAAVLTAMGIAGPIGLKVLAAVAGKALVISKVALTIAGILALKKIFAHDRHEETSFQVHAGHDNRRTAYVVRNPAKMAASVDPYRYYYEQQQQQQQPQPYGTM